MAKPKTFEQLRAEKERAETQLAQEQRKYNCSMERQQISGQEQSGGNDNAEKQVFLL